MTTLIQYPKITIGDYDIIVYPDTLGGQVFAMVYPTGERKAVWETLRYEMVEEAQDTAAAWIGKQTWDELQAASAYTERRSPAAIVRSIERALAEVNPEWAKVFHKVDRRNTTGSQISRVRLYKGRVEVYDMTVKGWRRPVLVYCAFWKNGSLEREIIWEEEEA